MSVGFVFSHDESGEEDDDEFDNGLDSGKFIVFACGDLVVYSSFIKTWVRG